MPTLLEKNKIKKQKWMSKELIAKIENSRSIDFLMDYIEDRMWLSRDVAPAVPLRGLGGKVLVLRSGTGSGKSTLLPPFLYDRFYEVLHRNIIITQPTKATATDIPYQILQHNKQFKLGETIGFQTGSVAIKPAKGVLFATYGILLQQLKTLTDEEFMAKYAFVIIDEVHSRRLEIDSCLFYLKSLLHRNWELPECPMLILTSATFDEKIYMDYFECPREMFLDVEGASFPVKDNFARFDISNYEQYIVDLVEKIHLENIKDLDQPMRDILIFVSGNKPMKNIFAAIEDLNLVLDQGLTYANEHQKKSWAKWGGAEPTYYLAPIAANSENIQKGGKEYKDIFSDISNVSVDIYDRPADPKAERKLLKTVPASRRVILGTNAIETGMTIDTLRYCVDSGFVRQSSFNPNFGVAVLTNQGITQASSRQRRGRVGRKAEGEFYAAYTRDTYDGMDILPFPEIVKEDITSFILGVIMQETETKLESVSPDDVDDTCFLASAFDEKYYRLTSAATFDTQKLDFIQYPSVDSLSHSLEKLHGLGFIDQCYAPTLFGYFAAGFRKISLENIRMILASYHVGANTLDLITITAFLQAGHLLGIKRNKYKPRNPLRVSDEQAAYYYKLLFSDDVLEYIFLWHDFAEQLEGVFGNKTKKTGAAGGASKTTHKASSKLNEWCKEAGINYSGMLAVIETRDELITDMLNMGLNPFYNGPNIPPYSYNLVGMLRKNTEEGMEEVRKIKKCIYEGYRFNLFALRSDLNYYSVHYKYKLAPSSKILSGVDVNRDGERVKPTYIIALNILLQESFYNKGMYEFSSSEVSVLDGFVDVDEEYLCE